MKRYTALVTLCALLSGCLTSGTVAEHSTTPDGTTIWKGEQKITAWGGATADAATQQFTLRINPDGSVQVGSGNGVENVQTPDTLQGAVQLVGALGGIVSPLAQAAIAAQAAQVQAPPAPTGAAP